MNNPPKKSQSFVSQDSKISNFTKIPSLGTIASALIIGFLVFAFFTGILHQFYASFLFLFYSVTNKMWISVMLLGILQTLLMIPFRVIRIVKSNNIQEIQQNIDKLKKEEQQTFVLRKRFRQGNTTFLFYSVDFVMQIVSYISLGRLFLTDFYNTNINPEHLYSWIKYPTYPIQDTWFKIPYPDVTKTIDLGCKVLLPVWIGLVILQLIILIFKNANKNKQDKLETTAALEKKAQEELEQKAKDKKDNKKLDFGDISKEIVPEKMLSKSNPLGRYATGYLLLFMILAWILIRHFPINWRLGIFSGDVTIPNRTFNTVTAIATFITMMWHSIPKIVRKGNLAEKMGISKKVIEKTQKEMFKESLFAAALVGLGAFYITNQIPSAFELSIFTLEVISLLSPFTLDKWVLGGLALKKDQISEAEISRRFK